MSHFFLSWDFLIFKRFGLKKFSPLWQAGRQEPEQRGCVGLIKTEVQLLLQYTENCWGINARIVRGIGEHTREALLGAAISYSALTLLQKQSWGVLSAFEAADVRLGGPVWKLREAEKTAADLGSQPCLYHCSRMEWRTGRRTETKPPTCSSKDAKEPGVSS